jgi:hypothetical protein
VAYDSDGARVPFKHGETIVDYESPKVALYWCGRDWFMAAPSSLQIPVTASILSIAVKIGFLLKELGEFIRQKVDLLLYLFFAAVAGKQVGEIRFGLGVEFARQLQCDGRAKYIQSIQLSPDADDVLF